MTTDMDRLYLPPTTFAGLSAILHVVALPLAGITGPAVIGALVWAILAFGLSKGLRWVAYLAFIMALFGTSAALGVAMGLPAGLGQWVWIAIIAADILAAITLFRLLWRPRTV